MDMLAEAFNFCCIFFSLSQTCVPGGLWVILACHTAHGLVCTLRAGMQINLSIERCAMLGKALAWLSFSYFCVKNKERDKEDEEMNHICFNKSPGFNLVEIARTILAQTF